MRLTTPAKVLGLMSLSSTEGSPENVGHALDSATVSIESFLETELKAGECIDYFGSSDYETEYRLQNAFVSKEEPFEIRLSVNGLPLGVDNPGEVLDPTFYEVRHDQGIVVMYRRLPKGKFNMSAQYAYGFKDGDEEDTLDAPDWLADAAAKFAISALTTYATSGAFRREKNVAASANLMLTSAMQSINQKRRPRLTTVFCTRSDKL